MPTFTYWGKEFRSGKAAEGRVDAANREAARADLARRGIHAQRLEEVATSPAPAPPPSPGRQRRESSGGAGWKKIALLLLVLAVCTGGWLAFRLYSGPTYTMLHPKARKLSGQCGWKFNEGALIRWWTLETKTPLEQVANDYQAQVGRNRDWLGGFAPTEKVASWKLGELIVDRETFQVYSTDARKPAGIIWVYAGNGFTYVRIAESVPTLWARAPLASSLPPGLQLALKDPQNATKLILADSKLSQLPPEVQTLTSLKRLDLSSNQLKTLPDGLSALTQLNILWLDGNPLTQLPPVVCRLKALKSLKAMNCGLATLPADLAALQQLNFLGLSGNPMSTVPPAVLKLPALNYLLIADSGLKQLPEDIGSLKTLLFMDVRRNQLSALPRSLATLKNMKQIKLGGNPLPQAELDWLRRALPGCSIDLNADPEL